MATLRSVLPITLLLLPIGCSREETRATNQEKIIGVWTLTKSTRPSTPPGSTTWEFTKDGEIVVTEIIDGEPVSLAGNYTFEKDAHKLEVPGAMIFVVEGAYKIQKLTDTDLVFEAKMNDKHSTIELKRRK